MGGRLRTFICMKLTYWYTYEVFTSPMCIVQGFFTMPSKERGPNLLRSAWHNVIWAWQSVYHGNEHGIHCLLRQSLTPSPCTLIIPSQNLMPVWWGYLTTFEDAHCRGPAVQCRDNASVTSVQCRSNGITCRIIVLGSVVVVSYYCSVLVGGLLYWCSSRVYR